MRKFLAKEKTPKVENREEGFYDEIRKRMLTPTGFWSK